MTDTLFTTNLVQLVPSRSVRVVPAAVGGTDCGDRAWVEEARATVGGQASVLEGTRLVAFRAAESAAPEWLALCLRDGYLPVVVGNAVELPFAGLVDYGDTVQIIGDSPAELELLRSLADSPTEMLDPLTAQGRAIWDKWFTPVGIDDGIRRLGGQSGDGVLTDGKAAAAVVRPNPFPAFRPDGSLVTEGDLFRQSWDTVGHRFPKGSDQPIVFFGAGRFLERMLNEVHGMPGGPDVLGIVDDRAEPGQVFSGLPVVPPQDYSADAFAAVFVATDSVEELLATRCREVYGDSITILRPSELMVLSDDTNASQSAGTAGAPMLHPPANVRRPTKIEAIIVCAGYGDMLAWTLPWNVSQFDSVAVVTSSDDTETRDVADACGARVVISDRFRDEGAPFNKGRMLNDGFAALDLDGWVLITDADMLFLPGMRQRLTRRLLHPGCLYHATRVDAPADNLADWLNAFRDDWERAYDLPFREPGRNRMPWGYFQLVHPSSPFLADRGSALYDEHFPTACDVDYAFQDRWPRCAKILLPELTVHIPHGAEGTNWSGRISQRLPS